MDLAVKVAYPCTAWENAKTDCQRRWNNAKQLWNVKPVRENNEVVQLWVTTFQMGHASSFLLTILRAISNKVIPAAWIYFSFRKRCLFDKKWKTLSSGASPISLIGGEWSSLTFLQMSCSLLLFFLKIWSVMASLCLIGYAWQQTRVLELMKSYHNWQGAWARSLHHSMCNE